MVENKSLNNTSQYWEDIERWAFTVIAVSLLVGCFWISAQDGVFSQEWGKEPFLYLLATLQHFVHYIFTGLHYLLTGAVDAPGHTVAAVMLTLGIFTAYVVADLWDPANHQQNKA